MGRAILVLALALSLPASARSAGRSDQSPSLPELPQIIPDNFPLSIREKVQKAYTAALAHPEDASLNGRLGMVLHAYQQSDERAKICYRRAHLLDPTSFRWVYYLGSVQAARGKYDEAIATLREALRLDPEYLPAQLKLGDCLLASTNAEEARQLYEGIVKRHPDSAQAHYGLGRARAANQDSKGAIESFRRACELFPYFGAAHYALALAYQRLGKADRAREEFSLYEKNKYDIPGAGDRLQAELNELYTSPANLIGLGIEFARQGKLEQATAEHEKALEIDPRLIRAHLNLISLYGRLRQFEKAEEHYRAALRLDPDSYESHYNYGVLLTEQDKYEEAEEAFRKVLEISPSHAEAHNNLGDLLQRQGKLAEAAEEFRRAIESRPNFLQAHFNLGRILVNQENYKEGIPELLKSLSTDDQISVPAYLYAVGAAYVRAGDRENGLRYIRMAREQAAAHHQSKLLDSIERDLRILEGKRTPH